SEKPMVTYTPSTGVGLVHSAEYVEEATFGTFPTNPAMLWVGADLQWDDSPNLNSISLGALGSEDLKYILGGKQEYRISLDFAVQTSTPLKYLVNSQGGGAGTIDKSLSLLVTPKINGVTNYLKVTGARPDSGSIKWVTGKEIRANMTL